MSTQIQEIIGLIPAAGLATRLPHLTCSKEILTIVLPSKNANTLSRPRVACEYLLSHMKKAGIRKAYLVLREGKWDIPAYLGHGEAYGINLAYLMMGRPYGPPFTLDEAYPFVQQSLVALGFPDIIFESDDAYARLIARQRDTDADIVLGLFPADQSSHVDMVEVDDDFSVRRIMIKPSHTDLRLTWGIAIWTPVFTQFMHDHLQTIQDEFESPKNTDKELHVGDVIQAAIENGLRVRSVKVSEEPYTDIGIPENLAKLRTPSEGERRK